MVYCCIELNEIEVQLVRTSYKLYIYMYMYVQNEN